MQIFPQVEREWPSPLIESGWRRGADLLAGDAYVRLPLGVITVSGSERLEWLNAVTSQKLTDLAPAVSAEALVLDPRGHVELCFYLVDDGAATWILTEEPAAALNYLEALRFRAKVNIDTVSEMEVRGCIDAGAAHKYLDQNAAQMWTDPWPAPVGETTVFTPPNLQHPASQMPARHFAILPRAAAAQLEKASEVLAEADLGAWEADRIARWRPRLGREGMPGVLPHEVDWLRSAVSLQKGCYTGQETVAKLTNRGRPPRRLTFLDLDGSTDDLPAIGSEVKLERDGSVQGVLTSVAYHPEAGQIGLCLVNRRLDPREMLLVSSQRAAQTVIVDPSGDNPHRRDFGKPGGALGLRGRN